MSSFSRPIVTLQKGDYFRALLSDTTPVELPILISNDGFYKNVHGYISFDKFSKLFIERFIIPPPKNKRPTIPLRFKIVKDSDSFRRLSLPHPKAQLEACNFYSKYDSLICHYCSIGTFSLRYPLKEGSHFYISNRSEDMHKFKSDSVSAVSIDSISRNPASYFSYAGYTKLHEFFNSRKFDQLERQYSFMKSVDVAKCFDSIYTHSIAWATKSLRVAKSSTNGETFGGAFDRLMQSMNYNETNGIIIGPELSRIFAEIILTKVDKNLELRLAKLGHISGRDFTCQRYVDNYYIFGNSSAVLKTISTELSDCLDEYKMHINSNKTETTSRPFFTQKSMAIYEANSLIENIIDPLIQKLKIGETDALTPKRIVNPSGLMRKFSSELRKACHISSSSYDSVSNYILAALMYRIRNVLDGSNQILALPESIGGDAQPSNFEHKVVIENTTRFVHFIVEAAFHLFTLHPTVPSSLSVSHILISSANFLKSNNLDSFLEIKEHIQLWSHRLSKSASFELLARRKNVSPVEILNLLLALKSYEFDGRFYCEILDAVRRDLSELGYFDTVCRLFIFGDDRALVQLRETTFDRAVAFILTSPDILACSERAHLFIDLISCPYIDRDKRRKMIRTVLTAFNESQNQLPKGVTLSIPDNASLHDMIDTFQAGPWFASWDAVNLLRLIEKKQLKEVYS